MQQISVQKHPLCRYTKAQYTHNTHSCTHTHTHTHTCICTSYLSYMEIHKGTCTYTQHMHIYTQYTYTCNLGKIWLLGTLSYTPCLSTIYPHYNTHQPFVTYLLKQPNSDDTSSKLMLAVLSIFHVSYE